MKDNIVLAALVQGGAWVMIVFAVYFEWFGSFLAMPVNNTPAFWTVSKWLLQTLLFANVLGYLVGMLFRKQMRADFRWSLPVHGIVSLLHVGGAALLIFALVGFEDL